MAPLFGFLKRIKARKAALGIVGTAERAEPLCNRGANRTPEKRELLLSCAERALTAGQVPVPAYY